MTNKDFNFWQDSEYSNSLSYENEKTTNRYCELKQAIVNYYHEHRDESIEDICKKFHAIMREECDPQEVYVFEYNDHECCLSGDDYWPWGIVRGIFGNEAASKIKRVICWQVVEISYQN